MFILFPVHTGTFSQVLMFRICIIFPVLISAAVHSEPSVQGLAKKLRVLRLVGWPLLYKDWSTA